MPRYALYGIALAALFVVGCKSACLEKQGEVRPAPAPPAVVVTPTPTPAAVAPAPAPPAAAGGYEVLTLTVQVPPEIMNQASKQGAGCPASFLMNLFGFEWSSVHGCVIGKVTPGGLAASAGLKPGDGFVSCNGKEIGCPSSFEPTVRESVNGPHPGQLVLVIHRPLGGAPAVHAPAPGPPK